MNRHNKTKETYMNIEYKAPSIVYYLNTLITYKYGKQASKDRGKGKEKTW